MSVFRRITDAIRVRWLIYVKKDIRQLSYQRYRKEDPHDLLRHDFPLNPHSVVLDVGGFEGDWSATIAQRYDPTIYICEPVPQFYSKITTRFTNNPKIHAFNVGLAEKNAELEISCAGPGSSLYRSEGQQVRVKILGIQDFLSRNNISHIDLVKINIEGGEYDLLKCMFDSGLVRQCKHLLIQFHVINRDSYLNCTQIQQQLALTHQSTFMYPFIWERWDRIKAT